MPRDIVFVVDVSGSMTGAKIEQAKKAVKHCLSSLHSRDRFAVFAFATEVQRHSDKLLAASRDNIDKARQWVDSLEATGGTAIDNALSEALALRPASGERNFTVVFFTDGQPTIGETDPEKIVKNVSVKNSASTRIFTFGVGDDVNAALLDRLAEMTRSASAYVRPEEDIEVKVSGLYGKISHPVMADLKLTAGAGVTLTEMYPKQLPDLFHGGQLVVLGSYKGKGHVALTLSGKVESDSRDLVYEVEFPAKTSEEKAFVENLWARRKVGYLLDQIRTNGQQQELVDEVTRLAKKHGITTPYTSYLVVPDSVAPVASTPPPVALPVTTNVTNSTAPAPSYAPAPVTAIQTDTPYAGGSHGYQIQPGFRVSGGFRPEDSAPTPGAMPPPGPAAPSSAAPAYIGQIFMRGGERTAATEAPTGPLPQAGKEGVELAVQLDELRNQVQAGECKSCQAAGRTCREFRGIWIDEGFKSGMKTVTIKAMSEAYFKLLAKHPQLKDVFRLGNRLVWVTPSGAALVIDTASGIEKMPDTEIDKLFVVAKH